MSDEQMTISQLIATLAARDIRLWVEEGSLKYSAPPDVFDEPLRAAVACHKPALIEFLSDAAAKTADVLPSAPDLPRPPLSAGEERLWFLYRYQGPSSVYNVLMTMHVAASVTMLHHRMAVNALIQRHESLRTAFAEADGVAYRVIAPAGNLSTPLIDLTAIDSERARQREVFRLIAEEEQHLFALDRDSLVRSSVIRLGESRHVLMINVHHAVTDAWSSGVLAREYWQLVDAYERNEQPNLPPVLARYSDFAYWQKGMLSDGGFDGQLAFWESTLAGLPPLLDLPIDYQRPVTKSYQGRSERIMLPTAKAAALSALCRQTGATLFMGLLAIFKLMLARYCNTADIAVGTAVAGRRFPELVDVVGMFTNTIVIRTQIDQNLCYMDLLEKIKASTFAAQANQDVPFTQVVERLVGGRSLSHTPLYQVSLAVNNAAEREVTRLAEIGEQYSDNDGVISTAVKDDLSLQFRQFPEGLEFKLTYDIHLFSQETAQRMITHFDNLLARVLEAPEQPLSTISLLGEDERRCLLAYGGELAQAPKNSLYGLFRAQSERNPDVIALQQDDLQISYRLLDTIVNRLAQRLQDSGVRAFDRVGLSTNRAAELAVAMLATVKIGASYVPLDRTYPTRILDHIIGETGLRVVLTTFAKALWTEHDDVKAVLFALDDCGSSASSMTLDEHRVTVNHPAYVIYTSGSTGQPKGVEVSHGNVVRLVQSTNYVDIHAGDVFVQISNHLFDAATFEVWGALTNGARLVHVDRDLLLELRDFPVFLRDVGATTLFITVALFNQLVSHDPIAVAGLRHVFFGGEAANPDTVRRVFLQGKPKHLANIYGPTENTTFSTWHEITTLEDVASCPIGRPISGSTAHVVDRNFQLAPIGTVGELLVGGDGVALGYIGRPDLTADRFVPDPFSSEPGQRLYRTGDWVRRNAHGDIEYIGRFDNQVKIRGFRVELGEIESHLCSHPSVSEAAVLADVNEVAGKRLIAYLVSESGETDLPAIRDHMRERLPEYKLPAGYVFLNRMPLTANGKADHDKLHSFEKTEFSATPKEAPRDALERKISKHWCELLDVSAVSSDDNFFELGGHSLLAITLSVRLRDELGAELSTRDIFEQPTLAALADRIRNIRRPGVQPMQPISRVGKREKSTLSFMQQRLWFLDQMQGPSATYHMPIALKLTSRYSADTIVSVLQTILSRHESLRTAIVEANGVPRQRISAHADLPVTIVDFTDRTEIVSEQIDRVIGEHISRPFDLSSAPLVRALMVRLPGDEHILVVTVHHIVCDGWSLGLLMNEFAALLQNPPVVLPELPLQYGDYSYWQKTWMDGDQLENQLVYWRDRLAGAPPLLNLHCAKTRSAERRDAGLTRVDWLDLDLARRLKELAVGENCSLFMVMLAGFSVLLSRYAGHGDIVVGTPIANRPHSELEPLIGFFANTLVLRTQVNETDDFRTLLAQVRDSTLEAYSYQDTPFDLLVDALNIERSLSYTPLVQVVFAQENFSATGTMLPDGVEQIALRGDNLTSKFDLNVSFEDRPDGIQLYSEFNVDLFDDRAIARLIHHYRIILDRLATDASSRLQQLQLLNVEADTQALDILNRHSRAPVDPRPLHVQVIDIAKRKPDAIALIGEDREVSYARMVTVATDLASRLRLAGVNDEMPVGICMQRSPRLVLAVLATLMAGASYVPLDPDQPGERWTAIIQDAGVSVVMVDETTRASLSDIGAITIQVDDNPGESSRLATASLAPVDSDALAYVMYTSGSSGKPKGVAVTHGAISRLVRHTDYLPFEEGLRFILSSSVTFDLATLEIWGALLNGGQVVVVSTPPTDLREFTDVLQRYRVQVLWLTASLFGLWAQKLDRDLPDLRYLLAGGDVVPPDACARARGMLPEVVLLNGYGPTENTTFSSVYEIPRDHRADESVPIGRSIANSTCYVLDEMLQPVPVGVIGMLYVGGAGLARGYYENPGLTAERFVPDRYTGVSGGRLYCTGDRVVLGEDGMLRYVGRDDRQVKIRGFRVELDEVEELLRNNRKISEAVVIAQADRDGHKHLVAFLVPESPNDDISALRASLREEIPDYLVPSTIIPLDSIPMNASGKADRKLLAAHVHLPDENRKYVPPKPGTEAIIAEIWSELLSRTNIGREDNFFELGGHSLFAAQACVKINARFGIDLRVRTFYASQHLAALAESVDKALGLERELDDIDLDRLTEEEAERLLARMQ